MSLEVFILGTGGMMPLPGRFLTSVLVRREGDLFLFDCGEATQISLRKLALRWKKISTIFISHTHADHVTGLPGILMLSSQVDRDDPLVIVGPPRVAEYIEAHRNILEMYINYEIRVVEIHDSGSVYTGDGWEVRALKLNHSRICMGYVLEEDIRPGIFFPDRAEEMGVPRGPRWSELQAGNSVTLESGRVIEPGDVMGEKRKGRKFAFVTDTLPTSEMAGFVEGSDLFVCEAMFTDDLAESAREKKHLTAHQAATIARDAGVGQLGLIHYSPRYTKRDLQHLLSEAKEIFPGSFLTRDGQTISLANPD